MGGSFIVKKREKSKARRREDEARVGRGGQKANEDENEVRLFPNSKKRERNEGDEQKKGAGLMGERSKACGVRDGEGKAKER